VVGVAHHLYERGDDGVWDWRDPGPDSYADEMAAVGQSTDKPLFQTEFNTDEDRGVDGGLETAWLIHHTLVAEGAVAFLYWDLIWPDGKGLVSMRGLTPEPRDQYYSLRHFARFTDPGYVRVGTESTEESLIASAYVAPDGGRLTVVMLNTGKRALDAGIDAGALAGGRTQAFVTSYRAGRSRRWQEQAAPVQLPLRLPAHSIATVVFERP
jgi:O-glycosyl hydrolase